MTGSELVCCLIITLTLFILMYKFALDNLKFSMNNEMIELRLNPLVTFLRKLTFSICDININSYFFYHSRIYTFSLVYFFTLVYSYTFALIFVPESFKLFAGGVLSEDEKRRAVSDLLSCTQTPPAIENRNGLNSLLPSYS